MATIVAGWARAVLAYATSQGLDRGRLLQVSGIEESLLASPDLRVDHKPYLRLWKHVEQQLGQEDLGLRMSQTLAPEALGLTGLAARASSTLGEALELFVELYPLFRDWGRAERALAGHQVLLRSIASPHNDQWSRSLADAALGAKLFLGQQWLGQRYPLQAVHFKHERPRDMRLYEELFPCPVLFGQPYNQLVLRREVLELPFPRADAPLRDYLSSMARMRLGALSSVRLVREVQEALDAEMRKGEGAPRIEQIARRLCTSTRSLQRHLRTQGRGFQELVDEARHRHAVTLLNRPGTSMREVSDTLGFSDPRAFRRALRRWMQKPPHTSTSGGAATTPSRE